MIKLTVHLPGCFIEKHLFHVYQYFHFLYILFFFNKIRHSMYLYERSPYHFDKKYCVSHSKSKSIEKIITSRLEDLKILQTGVKKDKQGEERDYCAFGLSRRYNVKGKDPFRAEPKEIKANFNASQQKIKENLKQEFDSNQKHHRNRVKLTPLKQISLNKKPSYTSCMESPVEVSESLKPKFIF